jgi:hypothetical protein
MTIKSIQFKSMKNSSRLKSFEKFKIFFSESSLESNYCFSFTY